MTNRGTESAREIEIDIETPVGAYRASPVLGLAPGASRVDRIDIPLAGETPGETGVVRVLYRDEEGYPFSALAHAVLDPEHTGSSRLEGSLSSLKIGEAAGDVVLSVRDVDGRPVAGSARLFLPHELSVDGSSRVELDALPGGEGIARFRVANRWAFPGSSYRIYARVDSEGGSLLVPATIAVRPRALPTQAARAPLLWLAALCVIVLVVSYFRDLPASAAGSHPRLEIAIDTAILLGIGGYLLAYLRPSLLTATTTATGGDTASHVLTAQFLNEILLPEGRILGWMHGNLAGFPIFQLYFPAPFLMMEALSSVTGLAVAFRLVTVLGTFALPACAYLGLRKIGFGHPVPALAAAFTIPFLMSETTTVWGGNLPSTLAGEFSYSIALSLTVLFACTSFRGLAEGRHLGRNAALLALLGASHAYALLCAGGIAAAHLLWLPRPLRNLGYLARLYLLAFCLLGFWIIPLVGYAAFTTPYRDVFPIGSWREVLPPTLVPLIALVGGAAVVARARRRGFDVRVAALFSGVLVGALLYCVAPRLGVVDVRFLPFVQLFCALLAAPAAAFLLGATRPRWLLAPILAIVALLWTDSWVRFIPRWIEWNYSGFERKPLWEAYSAVNRELAGGIQDPRVVFEHSPAHNAAGSIRAFESLPLFAGRSTLEGPYIQSSINSPFIFYLQSEISEIASCPLPDYHCARLDVERAHEHLREYNVARVIARSPALKAALARSHRYELAAEIPPFEIHRVLGNADRYVVPLANEPVVLEGNDWKREFFRWFRRPGASEVVLVHTEKPDRFTLRVRDASGPVPRVPLPAADVVVEERIEPHRVSIRTSHPGRPLLVRISYHPRWHVQGARRVDLASPGFMLVIPEAHEVILTFGDPPLVRFGQLLTVAGVLVLIVLAVRSVRPRTVDLLPTIDLTPRRAAAGGMTALGLTFCVFVATRLAGGGEFAPSLYETGLTLYKAERFVEARLAFDRAIAANPLSSAALHASFYRALSAYRQDRWGEAESLFAEAALSFPDSPYAAEIEYHLGLCRRSLGDVKGARRAFERVGSAFPETPWAAHAAKRLAEL